MDIDQIQKRLQWLEDEHRKEKMAFATLEERLANVESNTSILPQQIKELDSHITRIAANLSRLDQIESAIVQLRVDANRSLDQTEKARIDHAREVEKSYRADLEGINKGIADLRQSVEQIGDLKKSLQLRIEEGFRLGKLIEELEHKLVEYQRSDDEFRRMLRLIDESTKQDNKRFSDLQGEVAAQRKRLEEQRGKVDVSSETLRKIEMRLSEFQSLENERRQTQAAALEKQNLWQFERDRAWKEMQSKFEEISRQAANLEVQTQTLDATQRAVKRSQESFDEITTRFDRRINEISEMQRLVEDRFRQEWVTFKADSQKRVTNSLLAQEELQREASRQFEKLNERLLVTEDLTQEMRDQLHLIIEDTQKRLQMLIAQSHQFAEDHERLFGKSS